MGIKILLFFFNISFLFCNAWKLFYQDFKDNFEEKDIKGWKCSRNTYGYVQKCGNRSIIGGRNKFGKKIKFYKYIKNIPKHSKIKIKLTFWNLDQEDDYTIHPNENWLTYIDNKLAHKVQRYGNSYGIKKNICGSKYKDIIETRQFEFAHSRSVLKLLFTDTYSKGADKDSWGLTDLEIYYDDCTGIRYGDLCLTEPVYQQCLNKLKLLHDYLENSCVPEQINKEKYFKFTISYKKPYKFDPTCFSQLIDFQDIQLQQGYENVDNWIFNSKTQQITYRIKHSDLESRYKCKKITQKTQYLWVCDTSLHIIFAQKKQIKYSFQLQLSLQRYQQNELSVNLLETQLVGTCCTNELEIGTRLRFCTSYTCEAYFSPPYLFNRLDDIYIEHSISSPEFSDYFLQGISLKLGPIIPQIIKKNGQERGRVIYHIRSYLSFDDLVVEAISRLDERPQYGLRTLQEENNIEELGEDYKVKAEDFISVLDENNQIVIRKQENSMNEFFLYGFIAVCSLILTFIMAYFLFRCYTQYKTNKKFNNINNNDTNRTNKNNNNICTKKRYNRNVLYFGSYRDKQDIMFSPNSTSRIDIPEDKSKYYGDGDVSKQDTITN